MTRRRKHWGWGYEDEQLSPAETAAAAGFLREHLGFGGGPVEEPVALELVTLPPPRLAVPGALRDLASTDVYTRARHSLGSSYRDVVRGFRGHFENVPDVVVHPCDEGELERVLTWALDAGAAVIPYGGGTSVVGGVEPRVSDHYTGTVSIDLRGLNRVLEVDEVSRAARIQAGALGPELEGELRERDMTLRFYPQSFQFSTLGGWIATRAGGHFATLLTHIDDLVESVRALTPAGWWESRRLPGSGAGVSPDRMLIGSEGTLGIIAEAWVRIRPRPSYRAGRAVRFARFAGGAAAARAIAQSGLYPSAARLIDAGEAAVTGAGDGRSAVMVLGFESSEEPVEQALEMALKLCRGHGGEWDEQRDATERPAGQVASWREAFLRAPYLRDTFVAAGILSETFETAITWERFDDFHTQISEAATEAVQRACGAGRVTCRFTHLYPDGPAPYYTVLAPARRGAELEQWAEIKQAASEAILAAGGTITHHHAVGRDHRPWYDRQRPDVFCEALRAAKAAVDPAGALNPGVLLDPRVPRQSPEGRR